MGLAQLTRESVLAAARECDNLGADEFRRRYGFGAARGYFLVLEGRRYDSNAIAGVAHGFAVPSVGPLRAGDFSGGDVKVARALERLGFSVQRPATSLQPLPLLTVGTVYFWNQLGEAFDFKPSLFQIGGGMLPRPAFNALLLITHPGGARSFDYDDRWDDSTTLIYTGRGKNGDQQLKGSNRDVAENRKRLLVFEAAGTRQLRYLGEATCGVPWPARQWMQPAWIAKFGNSRCDSPRSRFRHHLRCLNRPGVHVRDRFSPGNRLVARSTRTLSERRLRKFLRSRRRPMLSISAS